MKRLSLMILPMICAACANFPELDNSEPPSIRTTAFPKLVPLDETLGPPINPENEATEVEEDLTARGEALAEKAEALQNAEIN